MSMVMNKKNEPLSDKPFEKNSTTRKIEGSCEWIDAAVSYDKVPGLDDNQHLSSICLVKHTFVAKALPIIDNAEAKRAKYWRVFSHLGHLVNTLKDGQSSIGVFEK